MTTYATFLLARKYDKKVKRIWRKCGDEKERLVFSRKTGVGYGSRDTKPSRHQHIHPEAEKRICSKETKRKDEYNKFIEIMRGELNRVDRIVEEFLPFNQIPYPFSSENIYNLVEDVVIILHEKAAMKNVTLINNVARYQGLECQTEGIKQAFYNIILNGVEGYCW